MAKLALEPPIARTRVWPMLVPWFLPQLDSENKSRFPLRADVPDAVRGAALRVRVLCVCGRRHHPVRTSGTGLAMFLTGPGHKAKHGCPSTATAQSWTVWCRSTLGKLGEDEFVQGDLFS